MKRESKEPVPIGPAAVKLASLKIRWADRIRVPSPSVSPAPVQPADVTPVP